MKSRKEMAEVTNTFWKKRSQLRVGLLQLRPEDWKEGFAWWPSVTQPGQGITVINSVAEKGPAGLCH